MARTDNDTWDLASMATKPTAAIIGAGIRPIFHSRIRKARTDEH
jgi:hypothetical protein